VCFNHSRDCVAYSLKWPFIELIIYYLQYSF